jgi:hypothetical protein
MDCISYIGNQEKREIVRQLLVSKIPKPETPKENPETCKAEPVVQTAERTTQTAESVSGKLIKFLSENNLDYTFRNSAITVDSNDKLVAFALENNISYAVRGSQITIALQKNIDREEPNAN